MTQLHKLRTFIFFSGFLANCVQSSVYRRVADPDLAAAANSEGTAFLNNEALRKRSIRPRAAEETKDISLLHIPRGFELPVYTKGIARRNVPSGADDVASGALAAALRREASQESYLNDDANGPEGQGVSFGDGTIDKSNLYLSPLSDSSSKGLEDAVRDAPRSGRAIWKKDFFSSSQNKNSSGGFADSGKGASRESRIIGKPNFASSGNNESSFGILADSPKETAADSPVRGRPRLSSSGGKIDLSKLTSLDSGELQRLGISPTSGDIRLSNKFAAWEKLFAANYTSDDSRESLESNDEPSGILADSPKKTLLESGVFEQPSIPSPSDSKSPSALTGRKRKGPTADGEEKRKGPTLESGALEEPSISSSSDNKISSSGLSDKIQQDEPKPASPKNDSGKITSLVSGILQKPSIFSTGDGKGGAGGEGKNTFSGLAGNFPNQFASALKGPQKRGSSSSTGVISKRELGSHAGASSDLTTGGERSHFFTGGFGNLGGFGPPGAGANPFAGFGAPNQKNRNPLYNFLNKGAAGGAGFLKPNNLGNLPKPNNLGNFPKPNNLGNFPQPNNLGNFAQPNNLGNFPQSNNLGNFPQPNNVGNFPQPNNLGNFPQPNNLGNFPSGAAIPGQGSNFNNAGNVKRSLESSSDVSDLSSGYADKREIAYPISGTFSKRSLDSSGTGGRESATAGQTAEQKVADFDSRRAGKANPPLSSYLANSSALGDEPKRVKEKETSLNNTASFSDGQGSPIRSSAEESKVRQEIPLLDTAGADKTRVDLFGFTGNSPNGSAVSSGSAGDSPSGSADSSGYAGDSPSGSAASSGYAGDSPSGSAAKTVNDAQFIKGQGAPLNNGASEQGGAWQGTPLANGLGVAEQGTLLDSGASGQGRAGESSGVNSGTVAKRSPLAGAGSPPSGLKPSHLGATKWSKSPGKRIYPLPRVNRSAATTQRDAFGGDASDKSDLASSGAPEKKKSKKKPVPGKKTTISPRKQKGGAKTKILPKKKTDSSDRSEKPSSTGITKQQPKKKITPSKLDR